MPNKKALKIKGQEWIVRFNGEIKRTEILMEMNSENKLVEINGTAFQEGDWISLNGSTGNIYKDKISLIQPNLKNDKIFIKFMQLCDKYRKIKIRTNVDTPDDAKQALDFKCEGIGLCRTEHMFFDPDRITAMREMILSKKF